MRPDRAALTGHLAGHGVGFADLVSPESPPDWDDGELSQDDGATDSGGHLLAALDSQPDVAVVVSDGDESLEPCPLSGPGLLLHGHDLQHLVLQGGTDEHVDDLELLDGHGEEIDLLERLDLAVLDETSELGDWDPLLLLLTSSSASTASAATTSTVSSTTASSISESSTESSSIGWSLIRHY